MKAKNFVKKILPLLSARNIFVILGVLIIFLITLKCPTDPDMGWHLADGKYLLDHNLTVARADIFSHSMASFPLIMHEWATDIWMFVIYHYANLFALSVIFALITTSAFVLAAAGVREKLEYRITAAMLAAIASIPVTGLRPQMITLAGLALVIYTIFSFRENPDTKKIFLLPVIFCAWVNFHGGFAVGLFFIAVYISVELAKRLLLAIIKRLSADVIIISENSEKTAFFQKIRQFGKLARSLNIWKKTTTALERTSIPSRRIIRLIILYIGSLAATLINPYGWRMYIEVFTTIFDKYAKANIGEWLPVEIANPMSWQFLIYLILFAILLLFSWRKMDYTYFLVSLPFLYLAFSSWRHMPVFVIVATPFWVYLVLAITGEELKNIMHRKWFLGILALTAFLIARQQFPPLWKTAFSLEKLAENGGYPYKAVEYLRNNPIEGNMFNEYNWGGYLIWQYPEKKVYIDGRMPSWRLNGFSIFQEFNDTVHFQDGWEKTLAKYDIGYALLYNNWMNDAAFSKIGWKKVYSDGLSAVYQKP